MSGSEQHFTFRWKITTKPDGGFVAVSDDPADNIEGATREEVEGKIKEKLAAALGADIAVKIDLSKPGTHVTTTKKFSFSLGGPSTPSPKPDLAQQESTTPVPIDAGSSSMLGAVWKIALLVGVAIIIYLLLQHH